MRDIPYLICFLFFVVLQIAVGAYYTAIGNGKTFAEVYGIPPQCETDNSRNLHMRQLATSNIAGTNYSRGTLDGAGPIFSLLGEYSGIFLGSIAFSFALAFLWIALLKSFAKPIVWATVLLNAVAIGGLGANYVRTPETSSVGYLYLILGVLVLLGCYFYRERINMTGSMMEMSCQVLNENLSLLSYASGAKVVYCEFVGS